MDFFKKEKQELQEDDSDFMKQAVLVGAGLETLRDIKERLDRISFRLAELERKFEERIPEKTITENQFKQEIVDSEEIVQKIISEVKSISRPIIATKEKLTIVESKNIEKIVSILREHEKLSSLQLSQILNLSRTRCNEYFKQMEDIGLVEGMMIGKEKYYKLKD
jgi:arsenate reductase-like glutaredoxin family protein